jgi:hypothetical protein
MHAGSMSTDLDFRNIARAQTKHFLLAAPRWQNEIDK